MLYCHGVIMINTLPVRVTEGPNGQQFISLLTIYYLYHRRSH
ncbi:hypothetical protein yinte0001_14780 [Yersinia intermedia ATCC 29909]|nr:hypothetical protein yinte0001_14780 [Yersinia intermedia ATCC 29909]